MGHQNKGNPHLPLQLDQLHLHMLTHFLVERAEGFVQQQNLGLQDQRPRQRHPLPLPTRKRMRRTATKAFQAHHLEGFFHRLDLFRLGPGILAQTKAHVFGHRHMRKNGVGLEHHIRRPLIRRHALHRLAVDQHSARGDAFKPCDGAQKRGLATAGRTQQRKKLTSLDGAVDPAQSMVIAIILMDVLEFDHRGFVSRERHRKPPVSLPPVLAMPRRRKYSAMVRRRIDTSTRMVPSASIDGTLAGKRNWPKI